MKWKKNLTPKENIPTLNENLSTPFQTIVTKKDDVFANRALLREISMETLTSPIIKSTKVTTAEKKAVEPPKEPDLPEIVEFAPSYILENAASSIKELKEIIAGKKPPKISLIINNDLSHISESERECLEKISLLNVKSITSEIRKSVLALDSCEKKETASHRYKIACVCVGEPSQNGTEQQKYLTADEIIAIRRKEDNEKKAKTEAFLEQRNDNKSIQDIAKFYYQGNIDQYD